MRTRSLLVLALVLWSGLALAAVTPGEQLADPALEARARGIGRELRCLVCQNQSIDDSDADLARDLRLLVRERLVKGDSDAAVLSYITERYGDFVLLKPPVRPATVLLWAGPALFLAIGAAVLVLWRRRQLVEPTPPLSDAERARVEALLNEAGAPPERS